MDNMQFPNNINNNPPDETPQQVVNVNPEQSNFSPTVSSPIPAPSAQPPFPPNPSLGGWKAIAALVLGIISVVTCLLTILSVPAAIIGIILGILGLKSNKKGISIAGIIVSSIGLVLSLLLLLLFGSAVLFSNSFMHEVSKNTPKTVTTNVTTTPTSDTQPSANASSTDAIYTDTVNSFSFNPGSLMQKASAPFVYSGNPFTGSGYTLISLSNVSVGSSSPASIKAALQSAKAKSFTGSDPNPVTLTQGSTTGYVINYTFMSSTGEKSEMWQMAFYTPKTNKVVVLGITSPYFDAATSSKFMTYAYSVFKSVKIN